MKAQLGITLYTELKNKIVLQHHRLNAIAGPGASIDAAGKNGGTTSRNGQSSAPFCIALRGS